MGDPFRFVIKMVPCCTVLVLTRTVHRLNCDARMLCTIVPVHYRARALHGHKALQKGVFPFASLRSTVP